MCIRDRAYDKSKLGCSSSHNAHNALSIAWQDEYFCVFASRRDIYEYVHTHEEINERYGANMVMEERMPEILSGAMGNQMYTVKLKTENEKDEFIQFVHAKR